MYSVFDIANKILAKAANNEAGDLISNLKLQKLLYYMQGFHLALFDSPLFENEIEAWQYGPVIPEVYHHFKDNGNKGITPTEEIIALNGDEENLFDSVFSVYGEYSAVGLMNLTHQESPWLNTQLGDTIDTELLKSFFKTRISY
ncbi:type II toxin-antitoxin system antitoxin SocA domain-containing protein [uncultured Draconibacterium sp.]|uniref:Panacea domain-containing protein n=1 Tax=uncultured Draconibacterium sp. TaxID=1573823 RepID=UPI0032174E2F